jgi:hypothetical protein
MTSTQSIATEAVGYASALMLTAAANQPYTRSGIGRPT